MKFLLKLDRSGTSDVLNMYKLGKCVFNLVSEGHRVVVVHENRESQNASADHGTSADQEKAIRGLEKAEYGGYEVVSAVQANKLLVSMLSKTRVTAFGFCGFDGNLVQLRLNNGSGNGRSECRAEVATVRPFWLDVIAEKGGVPVLANVGSGPDGTWQMLDADQLAARCAVDWNADVLIFVVAEDGVRDRDGAIVRWLDAENVDAIDTKSMGGNIRAKLIACCQALQCGVRRARIYPLSHIESLPDFYFTRIEYGTEITNGKSNGLYANAEWKKQGNGGSVRDSASRKTDSVRSMSPSPWQTSGGPRHE